MKALRRQRTTIRAVKDIAQSFTVTLIALGLTAGFIMVGMAFLAITGSANLPEPIAVPLTSVAVRRAASHSTATWTPSPTSAPPSPTPTATISAELVANPLAQYTVDYLTTRAYDGGAVLRESLWAQSASWEQWIISYTSDGIRVTGLMTIPIGQGDGPFPVLILLHGGLEQASYRPGDDTNMHARYFAQHGYLTIAPDYRTYNDTGGSGSPLKLPWTVDVMNLIAALPSIPEADSARVGVLGHSRGGGIGTHLMVISHDIQAISLYAPLNADEAVNWDLYANTLRIEWAVTDATIYGTPETNPEGYRLISPIYYLDRVQMAVQIHHGSADDVIPVEWSRDLAERLAALGRDVTYYEYPGAGHTFHNSDYNLFLERNLAFFDAYVKNRQ